MSVVQFSSRRAVSSPVLINTPKQETRAVEGRVQVRLTLDTLEQAERDLHLLVEATTQALATVRRALRSRDPLALPAVRAVLEATNKRLNVTPPRRK